VAISLLCEGNLAKFNASVEAKSPPFVSLVVLIMVQLESPLTRRDTQDGDDCWPLFARLS
jgi:hypothetical protein